MRNESRQPTERQDKAGGLGYNRELIGAAQALRSIFGASGVITSR